MNVYESRTIGEDKKPHYSFCGMVNYKNRLGAYVGWKPFLVMAEPNKMKLIIKSDDNDVMGMLVDAACDDKLTETIDKSGLSSRFAY